MVVRPALKLKQLSSVAPGELFRTAVGVQNVLCFRGRQVSNENEQFFLIALDFKTDRGIRSPCFMRIEGVADSNVVSLGTDYSIVIDQQRDTLDLKVNRFYDTPGSIILTSDGLFLHCASWLRNYSYAYYNLTTGDMPSARMNPESYCIFSTWSVILPDSTVGPNGFAPFEIFSFAAHPQQV